MSIVQRVLPARAYLLVAISALLNFARLATCSCVTHMQAKPTAFASRHEPGALDTVTMCTGLSASVPLTVLNSTTVLKLAKNNLTYIHEDSFQRFRLLEQLDVSYNQISSIGLYGFHNTRLLNLTLRGNQLGELTRGVFNSTRDLQILDLSSNKLISIDNVIFSPLAALESLDLTNNRIEKIAPDAFRWNVRLGELLLARNKIVTLHESTDRYLPASLTKWSLSHNEWRCDCHLRWFKQLLQRSHAKYDQSDLRCHSGALASAQGELWAQLRYDAFTCAPNLLHPLSATTKIAQAAGSTVVFACRTDAAARAETVWYKDWRFNWTAHESTMPLTTDSPNARPSQLKHEALKWYGSGNRTTTLIVRRLEPSDAGLYTCVVSNDAGYVVGNYSLAVILPAGQNAAAAAIGESPLQILAIVGGLFGLVVVVVSALACSAYVRKERARKQKRATTPAKANGNGNGSGVQLVGVPQFRYDEVDQRDELVDDTGTGTGTMTASMHAANQSRFAFVNGHSHLEATPKFRDAYGAPHSIASSLTDGSRFLTGYARNDFHEDSRVPSPSTLRSSAARTVTFRIDVDENCPLHGHSMRLDESASQDNVESDGDALWTEDGDREHYCPVHSPLSGTSTMSAESKYSTVRNGYRAAYACPVHGDSDALQEHHV